MSTFDRKRKVNDDQNVAPRKKFQRDEAGAFNDRQSHNAVSNHQSSPGSLPPLPNIDEKYVDEVFTHMSVSPTTNYDRLEFLGDAYIEVIASQLIYERLPDLPAGRMSQLRESLVKNETLGQYTVLYGLDKRLKQFKRIQNENKQAAWLKIKGDIFEAYVAAVVLSTPDGFSTVKKFLTLLWAPKVDFVVAEPRASIKSKEELGKKLLGKGVTISYVDEREPVIHYGQGKETYYVGVYLTGWGWENQYLGSGKGLSKGVAGQEAAAAALNNHPLIDEIIAARNAFYDQRKEEERQKENLEKE
nr:hypothetical protein LTR18_008421 [Exophiala xenobiotica]